MENDETYLGDFGLWFDQPLCVSHRDRRQHCYVIGQSGTGKSTLLHAMAIQDIHQMKGLAIIDPHGTLAHKIAASVPKERIGDVIYVNVADTDRPVGLNPLYGADKLNGKQRAKRSADVLGALKGIYGTSWGPELERVLMASLLALMDAPEVRPTLLSILQLIEDEQYRDKVSKHLSNNAAFLYFNRTLVEYRAGEFAQKSSSTSNKIFQIVANPMVANIFGQYRPSFDFADAMREGKILIFEVPQSALGGHFCHLVCALISSEIITTAMDRASADTMLATSDGSFEYDVDDFMLYIDEFQKAHTEIFSVALSEARKVKLCLTLAHQFLDQIDVDVRNSVLGNVGTSVVFRVSGKDAQTLADFDGERLPIHYRDLKTGRALIRAMIGGSPYTTKEVATPALPHYSSRRAELIKNVSRYKYGRTVAKVEKAIARELGTSGMGKVEAQAKAGKNVMRKQRRKLNQLVRRKRKAG